MGLFATVQKFLAKNIAYAVGQTSRNRNDHDGTYESLLMSRYVDVVPQHTEEFSDLCPKFKFEFENKTSILYIFRYWNFSHLVR
jgi:hypothetical protein